MGQIDLTKHNHCHDDDKPKKSNLVVITKKDGIQGTPGKNGITPHIDEKTGHWFFGDVDSGVSASGLTKDDISLLHFYEAKDYFPTEGDPKDVYIAEDTATIYRWNTFSSRYTAFRPNYVNDIEQMLANLQSLINNNDKNVLKKPSNIVPGSLILVDAYGNTKCTNVTYEELLDKVNSSGENAGGLPTNLVPGSLLVGSKSGGITSSSVSHSELLSAISNSKKAVKFSGEAINGSLVQVCEDGTIKSSGKTFNQLVEDIQNSSIQSDWKETNTESPAFIKNKPEVVTIDDYFALSDVVDTKVSISNRVVPGSLMIADASGNLKCSEIDHTEVVKKSDLVYGSKSTSIDIKEDKIYTIAIPQEVIRYSSINVYHNGNFLVEGTHYIRNKEFIILNGFFAYRHDIISFVGYGSAIEIGEEGSTIVTNLVGSKSDYVLISNDEVTTVAIPDLIRSYPAINVYHNGMLLIEGVHYSIDRTVIKLNTFIAYKNDIFNFVGYGSASLLPDELNTNHTHHNKLLLDEISQEKIDAWNTITTHNHDDVYLKKNDITPSMLPIATNDSVGVVKSSDGANKVSVLEDGTMFIKNIDISTLISNDEEDEGWEDFSIVLSAGSSSSYKH